MYKPYCGAYLFRLCGMFCFARAMLCLHFFRSPLVFLDVIRYVLYHLIDYLCGFIIVVDI